MADRYHEPALIVIDTPPAGDETVVLVDLAALKELCARHLIQLVQIEARMKDRVAAGDIHYRPVGKYAAHAVYEDLPFMRAMKIVAYEETAAEEVFPHLMRLRLGEIPVADLHGIEPGPVENIVSIV